MGARAEGFEPCHTCIYSLRSVAKLCDFRLAYGRLRNFFARCHVRDEGKKKKKRKGKKGNKKKWNMGLGIQLT